ncbi:OsmC family protein [Alkalibacter mobilis]|uniref:OsmC family protein n=1 Tax=Alkalibacter mobilis TaxID=2787712 RepID=UPI00189F2E32|nr:OsmC family protein [Alkalibacter mobilis]MBF7097554.1 OsmC family protein [Alkalibacter mobilis]
MNVEIKWIGKQNFIGNDSDGRSVMISPNKSEEAITPPDLLLMSLGSCTGLFMLPAAKSMDVELEDFEVSLKGTKSETPPKLFDKIHIHVKLKGDMTELEANEILKKSHEKCFVLHSLNPNIQIENSITIVK